MNYSWDKAVINNYPHEFTSLNHESTIAMRSPPPIKHQIDHSSPINLYQPSIHQSINSPMNQLMTINSPTNHQLTIIDQSMNPTTTTNHQRTTSRYHQPPASPSHPRLHHLLLMLCCQLQLWPHGRGVGLGLPRHGLWKDGWDWRMNGSSWLRLTYSWLRLTMANGS